MEFDDFECVNLSASSELETALLFRTLKYSTNKKISEFISSSKSESKSLKTELPKSTGVVTLIAYYFGENLNQIFKCFQKETTFSQILKDIPKSPFIACIGNTVATAETFYVIAEREVVCSCKSFFEAVAFQFASFYVFNIEYPKKALLTFDLFRGKKNVLVYSADIILAVGTMYTLLTNYLFLLSCSVI
uniref:uncharacterized protein LOC120332965 n=1 Tax=Styela clava TaxID=7725 RepID=UPI001939816A|nr:uncharacterized protein LOC120332965 [Styela clava]